MTLLNNTTIQPHQTPSMSVVETQIETLPELAQPPLRPRIEHELLRVEEKPLAASRRQFAGYEIERDASFERSRPHENQRPRGITIQPVLYRTPAAPHPDAFDRKPKQLV